MSEPHTDTVLTECGCGATTVVVVSYLRKPVTVMPYCLTCFFKMAQAVTAPDDGKPGK